MMTNPFLTRRVDPRLAALILLATVAAAVVVVSIAVVRANSTKPSTRTAPAAASPATVVPSSSPTGAVPVPPAPVGHSTPGPSSPPSDDGDDGAPATTSTPAGPPLDPARQQAQQFAAAWLNTTNKTTAQWRAGLDPYITRELAGLLDAADPATVPAGQIGTPTTAAPISEHLVKVTVPVVDAVTNTPVGTLTITVIAAERPLVSDVDWTAAP